MHTKEPRRVAYRFDRFTLDLTRGALLGTTGAELPLRPKSFALLQLFVESAGRLLDRDTIMRAVWPDVFVTDDSITQCVRDIRRALEDDVQRLLRTVPRRGYLFAAEVSPTEATTTVPEEPLRPSAGQPAVPVLPWAPVGDKPGEACRDDLLEDHVEHPSPDGALGSVAGPERRHLTVLFCDLVGSTALSERLDLEDCGSIIRLYSEHCAAAIAHFDGHIARYVGDGLLAYFGYPHACEDAAEGSVRAGLAIIEAIRALKPGPDCALQVRVGIATGLVVDEQIGETAQGQVAVGKPLNLAARLQTIAEPGTVVIADSTRRLVGELFALEDLGAHSLKGFTAPMQAWRVVAEGEAESRFEALRGASLTPLVGRRQELTLLLDRWEQAKEGDGQVVLLTGEPGIGKSRLIRSLRDQLANEDHAYLGYYCSPHRRHSPLQPAITQLERAASFTRYDDPGQKLTKLERLLAQGNENVAQLLPLIASLLSIPSDGRYPPLDMSPQLLRGRTMAALSDQLAGLASHRSVLLVWEDAHWADPTSLELLGLLIDRLQNLPVLGVVTFRREFVPTWPGYTHVTSLTINRLSQSRCSQLITGLTGGKSLPTVVLDQIVARAEGIPLFVEELTKAVLEAGVLRQEDSRYQLNGPLPPAAIPATLHDSLMARIDRLASAKEIAQIAAVIGREFSHELLAAIAYQQEKELAEALRQLIAAKLVFRRGMAPHACYTFKHMLVRDVAYASLLKGKRQKLHARIAHVLEERFALLVEAEPDVLAHHWTEAGKARKAAIYRLKAGQRALAHSAATEAVAQLAMGLKLLHSLPDGYERQQTELDLQITLGAALSAAKGQGAPETTQAYTRARELCDKVGEKGRLVPVLLGLWGSHNARDELGAARTAATQLLQLAEQKSDRMADIFGCRTLGATLFGLGEFTGARMHLQRLAAVDCSIVRESPFALPYDPWVSGLAWLALTLSVLGYPEQAVAHSDKALVEASRLRHHNTTSLVLCLRCSLGQLLDDHHDVEAHARRLLAIAGEQNFAYWAGLGMYFKGWALASAGEMDAGIEEMRWAIAACHTTGAEAYVPYNLALLADMCRRANDAHQGRQLLDEALDRLGRTESRYCETELLRIDGELRLAISRSDEAGAEDSFSRSIEIAHRQEAKVAELRSAMSLARLWAYQGKKRQAHDLLAPIYGWFTEGFTTKHLVEAKNLIETLAAS